MNSRVDQRSTMPCCHCVRTTQQAVSSTAILPKGFRSSHGQNDRSCRQRNLPTLLISTEQAATLSIDYYQVDSIQIWMKIHVPFVKLSVH